MQQILLEGALLTSTFAPQRTTDLIKSDSRDGSRATGRPGCRRSGCSSLGGACSLAARCLIDQSAEPATCPKEVGNSEHTREPTTGGVVVTISRGGRRTRTPPRFRYSTLSSASPMLRCCCSIHGWPTSSIDWFDVADRLSARFRVCALGLPRLRVLGQAAGMGVQPEARPAAHRVLPLGSDQRPGRCDRRARSR